MLVEHGVSGVITISGRHADVEADHSAYGELIRSGVPMVFVNGYSPTIPAPFVSCDDREAARLAVHHLAVLGHRRIGFAAGPERYVVVERKLAGVPGRRGRGGRRPRATIGGRTPCSPSRAVERPWARCSDAGATAVMAANDLMALGALLGARERGLEVPADVSVVGFDDTALIAFTDPPLTSVRQPAAAMCEHAVGLLIDRSRTAEPANHEYLFRPELIARRSSGPALTSARPSRR